MRHVDDVRREDSQTVQRKPTIKGDDVEQSIFLTQSYNNRPRPSGPSEEEKKAYEYINPLERVKTQPAVGMRKQPQKVNPLMSASENAMRNFNLNDQLRRNRTNDSLDSQIEIHGNQRMHIQDLPNANEIEYD